MLGKQQNDFFERRALGSDRRRQRVAADERFGSRPDLLILDGGKPQLTAAINELSELGLDIPMAGLAKKDEERGQDC